MPLFSQRVQSQTNTYDLRTRCYSKRETQCSSLRPTAPKSSEICNHIQLFSQLAFETVDIGPCAPDVFDTCLIISKIFADVEYRVTSVVTLIEGGPKRTACRFSDRRSQHEVQSAAICPSSLDREIVVVAAAPLPDLASCRLSSGGHWALDDAFTTAAVSVARVETWAVKMYKRSLVMQGFDRFFCIWCFTSQCAFWNILHVLDTLLNQFRTTNQFSTSFYVRKGPSRDSKVVEFDDLHAISRHLLLNYVQP